MTPPRRRGTDARLMRRASLTVALQTALAVSLVLAAVGVIALSLDARATGSTLRRGLRLAVLSADDVTDPPADVTFVMRAPGGPVQRTPGSAPGVARIDPRSVPDGSSAQTIGGKDFFVYAANRPGGRRVVGLLDRASSRGQAGQLVGSLLVAGLIGVCAAAGVGAVIGRRAVRPLAAALTLQRRFVADASHELRTPLTVIQTRAQLLRRKLGPVPGPDLARDELDKLVTDAQALGEVVEDLLLSAQLEHSPRDREVIDLGALATDLVGSFAPHADQLGIEVSGQVEATADRNGLLVSGAPTALRRAASALVDNALAHTPAGGRVLVCVARDREFVRLSVTDNGEGLDPAQTRQVLTRFARGPGGTGAGRRFGLGLFLVREVITAHGGTLRITGSPGSGATFTLVLPAAS